MSTSYAVTRPVQVAVVLAVIASLVVAAVADAEASHDFDDVPSDHPYHLEIGWMVDEGVTGGYTDDTFRPGAEVTRQALAAFLYRLAGEPAAASRSGFVDVPDRHPFHDAVAWAAGEGITTGYDDGTFRPDVEVTRQAAAALVFRAVGGPEGSWESAFTDVPADHPFSEMIAWLAAERISGGYEDGTFRPEAAVTRQAIAAFLQRTVEAGYTVDEPDPATVRASVATDGTGADRRSLRSSISPDGRYAAFISNASNLVPDDTNGTGDVFVHDLQTGRTDRVSVATDGTQANGGSFFTSISAGGRFVAFVSHASNLVPDDTNGKADVFVHDRETGLTERISLPADATPAEDRPWDPSISADGRYITFYGNDHAQAGPGQVFVHDRQTDVTSRVSAAPDGTPGNMESDDPSISADGRYIVFDSWASNLVADDTNGTRDMFVHDQQTQETRRISVATGGWDPSISADGRYVAFRADASGLVPDDTNDEGDVFVHDRQTGAVDRVSVDSGGAQGNGNSRHPSISADGHSVVFTSDASNLVPDDTNDESDVFVHDRRTGQTHRVSLDTASEQANAWSVVPSISADGRHVVFHSWASDLVPGDENDTFDVFVRRRW